MARVVRRDLGIVLKTEDSAFMFSCTPVLECQLYAADRFAASVTKSLRRLFTIIQCRLGLTES